MFLRKAMRYYRLWIYTCNAVLFASVVVFIGVSAGIITHPYITLVPAPSPYHPTVIYGYIALFLQAGILQTIGCFGAFKLSQKLLSTYWILLLFLLLGDLLVGLIWVVRFAHLTEGLKPHLINTVKGKYNKDMAIAEVWDTLQMEGKCCGVQGPADYYNITSFLPESCCYFGAFSSTQNTLKKDSALRYISHRQTENREGHFPLNASKTTVTKLTNIKAYSIPINITCKNGAKLPFFKGCYDHIIKWYTGSTETLMIFGFCVITFIKLCFVGILRFEIQEMIQKIKVLQGDANDAPNPELAEALGMVTPEKKAEGELLINSEEPNVKDTPQYRQRHNHISTQIDGADSDTNSHCALITDTPVRNPYIANNRKQNGNNNEITELRELCHMKQTQI